MKKMLFILFLFIPLSLFSQTVSYAYDAAGNRIKREIVLGGLRSSTLPEEVITEKLDIKKCDAEIRIYPNPTEGRFAVEINNVAEDVSGQIQVLNSQGQLLEKKGIQSEGKIDFDLTGEAAGIYILNIRLGEAVSTWKIIKK